MRGFLTTGILCVLFLSVSGDDAGFGDGDSPEGRESPSGAEKRQGIDEVLRPHVFSRYEKMPELEQVEERLYRALYRLPESVYVPDYNGELPDVRKWLESEGVTFGEGAFVTFDHESRILELVQTAPQLTRAELFFARFGAIPDVFVQLELFELPLLDGWKLIGETSGIADHDSIRSEALRKVQNGEGRILESFSSIVRSGERGKLERSMSAGAGEESEEGEASSGGTLFEFEPVCGGTENRISVNFAYERPRGEFEPRKVSSLLIVPNQGGVIAASWKEGGNLQFLYLGAEIRDTRAVTRVRRIAGE